MILFFPQKKVPECKQEWNREAITVFSRFPSLRRLQATPPLQTPLVGAPAVYKFFTIGQIFEYVCTAKTTSYSY